MPRPCVEAVRGRGERAADLGVHPFLEELMLRADSAVYEAKPGGRNQVRLTGKPTNVEHPIAARRDG